MPVSVLTSMDILTYFFAASSSGTYMGSFSLFSDDSSGKRVVDWSACLIIFKRGEGSWEGEGGSARCSLRYTTNSIEVVNQVFPSLISFLV